MKKMIAILLCTVPIFLFEFNGHDIIKKMHKKYHGKWYHSLTFTQKTEKFQNDQALPVETWYEALELPGKLTIKFNSKDSGDGIIFAKDSAFFFRKGQNVSARPSVHPLILLGFDVYFHTPENTISKLKNLGYDLSKFYEKSYKGRNVYVVGATSKDDKSNQFWIDKEHLYFVKSINYRGSFTSEIEFMEYQKLKDGWIAPKVVFKQNGKITMIETYRDILTDIPIAKEVFNPKKFSSIRW